MLEDHQYLKTAYKKQDVDIRMNPIQTYVN